MGLFDVVSEVNSVRLNDEMRRVEKLPRRQWTEEEAQDMADKLTALFRTPHGQQRLRPIQAVALAEIGMHGGLLGPIRVGGGKSLVSFLAPLTAEARRPALVTPAALHEKTLRDRAILRQHWQLPEQFRLFSYEWLGRAQAADALFAYQPDLIICDETHRLKNRKAAVTRRFMRYFKENPNTKFVGLSGTMTKRSLLDYAHMARWALGEEDMPLPKTYLDLELWADALDERKGQLRRADPGALEVLCNEDELKLWYQGDRRGAARKAFRRRLIDTPAIVATQESPIDASITINRVDPPKSQIIDDAFELLRTEWTTPDGWPLMDGLEVYRHAREIAAGLYYVWDPRPPRDWLDARKAWSAFARRVLSSSRTLDSELQVRKQYADTPELKAWLAIKDTFEPQTLPVWLDDTVLHVCADWIERERGILWTEHVHFAERLASITKVPYYGRGGLDTLGRSVEVHPPGEPMILSIQSNSQGRNLQAWNRNFIVSPPPNGQQWEQLMGRTHRDGQEADEVTFDVAMFCAEHVGAFWQARKDAEYVEATTGSSQKLLLASHDVDNADRLFDRGEPRWNK